MYSTKSGLIIGFHGCDKSVCDSIIRNEAKLQPSQNDYDWLGSGIYFWENNQDRAFEFAKEQAKRNPGLIKEPSVIGAVLDLGYCLDLVDSKNLQIVKMGYELLVTSRSVSELPTNTSPLKDSKDLLVRNLDCAVFQVIHQVNIDTAKKKFDSIRGVFWEGNELYPNAGFKEKNHIQICICNPNCIKGLFYPRVIDDSYDKV